MKRLLSLILLVLFSSQKCEEVELTSLVDQDNNIRIEIPMFPSPYSKHYLLDENGITVHLKNRQSSLDSLVEHVPIKTSEYDKIKSILTAFKTGDYVNKCIQDGQLIKLVLKEDSDEIRHVKFVNLYNESLDSIVQRVNNNISEDHKIYYDRIALEALPSDCN